MLVAAGGDEAWVLAEDQPRRSLGAALAWAGRHAPRAERVSLLATGGPEVAGTLARRAAWFARPPQVLGVEGTGLVEVAPAPLPAPPPLDPRADALRPLIERAGAECVVEGGLLRAEVKGLEVARVEVRDDGRARGGGPRAPEEAEVGAPVGRDGGVALLAVGVGKHDREAQLDLRGTEQGEADLAGVVRTVAAHRVDGGVGHAAYHLAPERWLRWAVVRRPEVVGARVLEPVASPVDRSDLRQPAPAPAAGVDGDGRPLLVVFSVGVDVDLVPAAVDAWLADGRRPRLVLCVPEGDDHRVTRQLAAALAVPPELVTVGPGWRSW